MVRYVFRKGRQNFRRSSRKTHTKAGICSIANKIDLSPEEWTPDYAVFRSACSGVMYPMAERIR